MFDSIIRSAINSLPEYTPGKNAEQSGVIKLASNENPFGPSPKAMEAAKSALSKSNIYPDQNSLLLREKLAERFALIKDNFIIGNGSDEIMLMIAQVFLSAGDEVIISRNTFSLYEFVSKLMDGKINFIELKDNSYDLDAMADAVTVNTKLIFLCNPNNPTGTMFSKDAFDKFIKRIPENIIIVVDEAYGDFADKQSFYSGIGEIRNGARNIIVLKTFSKLYGLAGLRIGYGIADAQLIKYLNMSKFPFNVNVLAQAAAEAALSDDAFVSKTLENNFAQKQYVYNELHGMGQKFLESQSNFICIELVKSADSVFLTMLKDGVIIRPLTSFGLPNSIRVSVGTPDQNNKFIQTLKKAI